jgi:phosphocarrier protein HPr
MPEITLTIKNKVGLHARPAAVFVQEANKFKSDVRVSSTGHPEVNGKSILGVLSLEAGCGSVIVVRAEGEDAAKALASILALTLNNFGEAE